MERLKSEQLTVNEQKCVSFTTTFYFLGYEASSDVVKLDPKHTDKFLQLQPPKSVKEVKAFIGLINYFGRMIPKHVGKTSCINELRQKKYFSGCMTTSWHLNQGSVNLPASRCFSRTHW